MKKIFQWQVLGFPIRILLDRGNILCFDSRVGCHTRPHLYPIPKGWGIFMAMSEQRYYQHQINRYKTPLIRHARHKLIGFVYGVIVGIFLTILAYTVGAEMAYGDDTVVRCGGSLIQIGTRAFHLGRMCGEPISKEAIACIPAEKAILGDSRTYSIIEEWIYRFSGDTYTHFIVERGAVADIFFTRE